MKTHLLSAAILASLGSVATIKAQAASVVNGDSLFITQGVQSTANNDITSTTGSYFAMDTNANSKISQAEKTVIGQGTTGLVIGVTTSPGASHSGAPTAGDTNAIDGPWGFFGNTGSDYTTVGITGSTTAGLNMSGWTVTWNGIPIPMGTGAWATGTGTGHTGATGTFANGVANFYWDGVYTDPYTLDYRATVPLGDPSGFGGVKYELHLEGTFAQLVPLPAAVWLLSSGLFGLLGAMRKGKSKS